jgi:hypothetical protein
VCVPYFIPIYTDRTRKLSLGEARQKEQKIKIITRPLCVLTGPGDKNLNNHFL